MDKMGQRKMGKLSDGRWHRVDIYRNGKVRTGVQTINDLYSCGLINASSYHILQHYWNILYRKYEWLWINAQRLKSLKMKWPRLLLRTARPVRLGVKLQEKTGVT